MNDINLSLRLIPGWNEHFQHLTLNFLNIFSLNMIKNKRNTYKKRADFSQRFLIERFNVAIQNYKNLFALMMSNVLMQKKLDNEHSSMSEIYRKSVNS